MKSFIEFTNFPFQAFWGDRITHAFSYVYSNKFMFREALHNALLLSLGLVSMAEVHELKWMLVELFYMYV